MRHPRVRFRSSGGRSDGLCQAAIKARNLFTGKYFESWHGVLPTHLR